MKVSFNKMNIMERVLFIGKMERSSLENGLKVNYIRGITLIRMGIITMESSKMTKETEKESLHLLIKIIMKGNGLMINIRE